jgi:hypothetical protein
MQVAEKKSVCAAKEADKENRKKYRRPAAVSMDEFSARTALGVSPAMKKKDNYVVSVLF